MNDLNYLYVFVTLLVYQFGLFIKKKTGINALLVAIAIMILGLVVFDVDVTLYQSKTSHISYLLTPATICLAIPLYEQIELLKRNWKAILV